MKSNTTLSNNQKNILIIRLSSIGDILLTTPFIRQVRDQFPKAKIDFVVKGIYKDLLKFNPHIDELITLNLDEGKPVLSEVKDSLKSQSYDIVFDLHNNLRSNFLKHHIGAGKIRSIHKGKLKQLLLVWFNINVYEKPITIPERYLAVGREFGVIDDGKGLELYWDRDINTSVDKKAVSAGIDLDKPFIGLAPGAGFYTKRWPAEKFEDLIKLIQHHNIQIVIFGSEEDREIGKYLERQKNVFDLCGHLTLLETASLIARGKIIVSNDTGLMHMTTAVGTPVLAIFGSTVKELGFFPYRAESVVIENVNLHCRPCSHIGRHRCPKNHFKCMIDISAEQVYVELKKFL